jgi:hypothetical protein
MFEQTRNIFARNGLAPISLIRFRHNGTEKTAKGRDAWALSELIAAGERGCTPIDNPGPRWSGYVLKLRKLGLSIETINEMHGGPYAGRHARYRLLSDVEVIESKTAAEAA